MLTMFNFQHKQTKRFFFLIFHAHNFQELVWKKLAIPLFVCCQEIFTYVFIYLSQTNDFKSPYVFIIVL